MVVLVCVVLVGCSGQPNGLTTTSYSGLHQTFRAWFPSTPQTLKIPNTGGVPSLSGVENWIAKSTSGNVEVKVVSYRRGIDPGDVGSTLRGYLPTKSNEKLGSRSGMPTVSQIVPCSTPAGPCRGEIANLTVLDGSFVYSVQSEGYDRAMSERVLDAFEAPPLQGR